MLHMVVAPVAVVVAVVAVPVAVAVVAVAVAPTATRGRGTRRCGRGGCGLRAARCTGARGRRATRFLLPPPVVVVAVVHAPPAALVPVAVAPRGHKRAVANMRKLGATRVLRNTHVVVYCMSKAKASAAYNQTATSNIISIHSKKREIAGQ